MRLVLALLVVLAPLPAAAEWELVVAETEEGIQKHPFLLTVPSASFKIPFASPFGWSCFVDPETRDEAGRRFREVRCERGEDEVTSIASDRGGGTVFSVYGRRGKSGFDLMLQWKAPKKAR